MVRFNGELGELHAFGSLAECPREGGADGDVFQEKLPLDFEGVVEAQLVGDLGPVGVIIDG